MSLVLSDSSTQQSSDVRSAAANFNWSKRRAKTNDEHPSTAASQSRSAKIVTPNAYISWSDDETEVRRGDSNTGCVKMYKKRVSKQKPKNAGKMKMNDRRCFKVNCVSHYDNNTRCKESFYSWHQKNFRMSFVQEIIFDQPTNSTAHSFSA